MDHENIIWVCVTVAAAQECHGLEIQGCLALPLPRAPLKLKAALA